MPFPNFKGKHSHEAYINPSSFMEYASSLEPAFRDLNPDSSIICFNGRLMRHVRDNFDVKSFDKFNGQLYFFKSSNYKLAINGGFGIGAPSAAATLEELISIGVRKVIVIGTAGSLQHKMGIGDIVLCNRAIRDEGVSHHYSKPAKYAYPDKGLTCDIKEELIKSNIKFKTGTSWTIDAPYRETVNEIRHYQRQGVQTVDMESAALFVVAGYRKVQIGAMFTISDCLAGCKWSPGFYADETHQGLLTLLDLAIKTLSR